MEQETFKFFSFFFFVEGWYVGVGVGGGGGGGRGGCSVCGNDFFKFEFKDHYWHSFNHLFVLMMKGITIKSIFLLKIQ